MNLKRMTCEQYFKLDPETLTYLAVLHYKLFNKKELGELYEDLKSICGLDPEREARIILSRELYQHITGKEFIYDPKWKIDD